MRRRRIPRGWAIYGPRDPRPSLVWAPIRRFFERPQPPPAEPPEPPEDEPALVGRHPRRPLNSGSVALETPPDLDDVDARGQEG